MAKITNEQYKDATESMMWTLSMFQTGFKTICGENPLLSIEDKIALTNTWWQGQMYLMSHLGNKNDDSKGLI